MTPDQIRRDVETVKKLHRGRDCDRWDYQEAAERLADAMAQVLAEREELLLFATAFAAKCLERYQFANKESLWFDELYETAMQLLFKAEAEQLARSENEHQPN